MNGDTELERAVEQGDGSIDGPWPDLVLAGTHQGTITFHHVPTGDATRMSGSHDKPAMTSQP